MKQVVVIFRRGLHVSVILLASITTTVVTMLRKYVSQPNFQPNSQQPLYPIAEVIVEVEGEVIAEAEVRAEVEVEVEVEAEVEAEVEVLAIPAIQETARHLVKLVVLMIHQVVVHLLLTTCVSAIHFALIMMTVAMTLKKYVSQLMFQRNFLPIVQLILHLIVEVSVSVQVQVSVSVQVLV
jgi:hypothetical protein